MNDKPSVKGLYGGQTFGVLKCQTVRQFSELSSTLHDLQPDVFMSVVPQVLLIIVFKTKTKQSAFNFDRIPSPTYMYGLYLPKSHMCTVAAILVMLSCQTDLQSCATLALPILPTPTHLHFSFNPQSTNEMGERESSYRRG